MVTQFTINGTTHELVVGEGAPIYIKDSELGLELRRGTPVGHDRSDYPEWLGMGSEVWPDALMRDFHYLGNHGSIA